MKIIVSIWKQYQNKTNINSEAKKIEVIKIKDFNSKILQAEERISELRDRPIEIIIPH